MAYTFTLQAPNSIGGFVFQNSGTGNSYTADSNGYIKNVASNDVTSGLLIGCELIGASDAANNFTATTDPTPTNDSSQDYAPGSTWVNTTAGRIWTATSTAVSSAIWRQASPTQSNFRNLLDGGDFTINPWQRGTSFSSIGSSITYTADRFYAVGNTSSAIAVVQSSISSIPGFNNALLLSRSSTNSSLSPIWLCQVIESADSYRAQGQQVTLSFWAQAGSSFSGASSKMTVLVNEGFSSNQSASSMMASSWTSFSSIINSSQVITSSGLTRYQFTGTVSSGASQLGIQLGYTPVGSSAGTSDNILFAGVQLEIGGCASEFEHRDVQVELEIAQRYAWKLTEPASSVAVAAGFFPTSSTQIFFIPLPVQMRAAPTVTVSSGTWVVTVGSSVSSGTISSGTTHTPNGLTVNFNATGGTIGFGTLLQGGSSGAGFVLASAEF